MKKGLLQALQIGVTVLVLAWLFHDPAKRDAMATALLKADWHWLLLAVFVGLVGEGAGILRWRLFLEVQEMHCRWWDITRWFFIGLFFNMILPGTTGGDLVRLFYLCRAFPAKRSAAVMTLLIDRVTSLIPLILFAAGSTWLNHSWLVRTPATAALLFSTLVFCGVMTLVIAGIFLFSGARLGEKLPRWLPSRRTIIQMSNAWHRFARDGRRFSLAMVLSVPVLFSYYGTFYAVSRAFAAGPSFAQIFSIMPIVTVISSAPVSVGGLGVREGLFERLLGDLCGTSEETASLLSLTGYAIFLSFGLIGAIFYIFAPHVDRQELARLEREAEG